MQSLILKPCFELEGRKIGEGQPVFIIAEIGINHNGDLLTAKKMINAAAECGVDAVKFQTFRTEEFMADRKITYEYEVRGKRVREKMFDMFKRLELPLAWHSELFDYTRQKKLVPLTSVADGESADAMEKLDISAYKLSSEDLINLPLVEHVIKKGKPLILSTGMADEEELDDVLRSLSKYNANQVLFLHCVSLYPTPDEETHLWRIKALHKKIGGPVGYSDHTLGILATLGAVSLGACLLEKHFTLDRHMDGPDHFFSADPDEMRKLVRNVRKMEVMLGDAGLTLSNLEIDIRKQFRRSLVASRDLISGQILSREDIVLKRPGNGIHPRNLCNVLGKRISLNIKKGTLLEKAMISEE